MHIDDFKKKTIALEVSGATLLQIQKVLSITKRRHEFNSNPIDTAVELQSTDYRLVQAALDDFNKLLTNHNINPLHV